MSLPMHTPHRDLCVHLLAMIRQTLIELQDPCSPCDIACAASTLRGALDYAYGAMPVQDAAAARMEALSRDGAAIAGALERG
jgi:hypothetical protein